MVTAFTRRRGASVAAVTVADRGASSSTAIPPPSRPARGARAALGTTGTGDPKLHLSATALTPMNGMMAVPASSEEYAGRLRRIGLHADNTPLDMPAKTHPTDEHERLADSPPAIVPPWRRWGCYVAERAWDTVREDYSPGGDAARRTAGGGRDRGGVLARVQHREGALDAIDLLDETDLERMPTFVTDVHWFIRSRPDSSDRRAFETRDGKRRDISLSTYHDEHSFSFGTNRALRTGRSRRKDPLCAPR